MPPSCSPSFQKDLFFCHFLLLFLTRHCGGSRSIGQISNNLTDFCLHPLSISFIKILVENKETFHITAKWHSFPHLELLLLFSFFLCSYQWFPSFFKLSL